jgi:two-component system sensor histidine kinase UhpB
LDLRRTLVVRLALFFAVLGLVFSAVWLLDLRDDAVEEQAAASRLVELLLAGNGPDAAARVAAVLARGDLRHVQVSLLRAGEEPSPPALSGWAGVWGLPSGALHDHRIVLGDRVLLIRPDPQSEIREKLRASAQVLAMLLLFGAACLAVTWFVVHRALAPVKELEAGLARLERGEAAHLPRFELREFAAIAGAVDWLAASLGRAREGQRRLTRQLMDVQDKERRELAAELHDEFGQSLTAISAAAAYIEHHAPGADPAVLAECAREIGNESRRISDHVRQLLAQLRPYGIEGICMGEALRELVAGWQARLPDTAVSARIEVLPVVPDAAGLALYRALQEALTNCVRHSGADQIAVTCSVAAGRVWLAVSDNGRGRAATLREQAGGGLLGMHERLAMAGGELQIEDAADGGITLRAWVPLTGEAPR